MTPHRVRVTSVWRADHWWHKARCRDCTARAAGREYQEQEDWAVSHVLITRKQAREAA